MPASPESAKPRRTKPAFPPKRCAGGRFQPLDGLGQRMPTVSTGPHADSQSTVIRCADKALFRCGCVNDRANFQDSQTTEKRRSNSRAPSLENETTRVFWCRFAHDSSSNRLSKARPRLPARCDLRSLQSRHSRQSGDFFSFRASTSIRRAFANAAPDLVNRRSSRSRTRWPCAIRLSNIRVPISPARWL